MSDNTKLVRGVGIKGDKYLVQFNGKTVKEYQLWSDMLRRCNEKMWLRSSSYTGVTCSENFKSYTFFYEWCNEQVGFGNTDSRGAYWHLDKDLLVKGNKLYSEDTCVFLPKIINQTLITKNSCRGDCLIGVTFDKNRNKFMAKCGVGVGITPNLGRFNTEIEAFQAYKKAKETYVKKLANDYKDVIDPRAYKALLNYTVEITD